MIWVLITPLALLYLACGALLGRWSYGYIRARAVDRLAEEWADPVGALHKQCQNHFWLEKMFFSTLLAVALPPVWLLTVGLFAFVSGSGRRSAWEKERELKESQARTRELEEENERMARKLRQPR